MNSKKTRSRRPNASSGEAEVRADLLVEKAQCALDDIQRDIDGLRLKRREVETSLESTIQTLRSTLDYDATGMDGTLKTRSCCIGPGRQATRRLAKRLRRGARSGGSSKTSDRLHLSDLVKHAVPAGSSEEMYEDRAEALQGQNPHHRPDNRRAPPARPVDNQRPALDVVAR